MIKKQRPLSLLRAAWRALKPDKSFRPNEAMIVFEALQASNYHGLMVDVGAHYGGSLVAFLESDWCVWAFEPDSNNRQRLMKGFGGRANIDIDSRAVSDRPQRGVTLYRSDQSSGISGLSKFHPSHRSGETVDVTTLGEVLEQRGRTSDQIDFLKIDTEGFDLHVLKGLPWRDGSPRVVMCEFEDAKTVPLGYDYNDLAEYLRARDYHVLVSEWYPIKRYGGPHQWRSFETHPHALQDPRAWGNLIAAREEPVYQSLLRICAEMPRANL